MVTPEKTVERLSLYRRLAEEMLREGKMSVFSHQLAEMAGVTSSQVRRDFMFIGTQGRANTGYNTKELKAGIDQFLVSHEPDGVALVGIGNLGRAVLAFFHGRRPNLIIKACFDKDPDKIGRIIHGCRVYSIEDMASVLLSEKINIAIIAVPRAFAQETAEKLIQAGVNGIVNFAPVPLNVPGNVYVDNVDFTMSLEKVAHFARKQKTVSEI
jgi:redox-sensing transcriptional repressor